MSRSADELPPGPARLALADVVVGERDRVDLGDVAALAASIADVGLLHPVVISPARQLIAGGRRLAAVRHLGWTAVPVTVAGLSTVEELLRGEEQENTCRLALAPHEASRARARRRPIVEEMARQAQAHGQTAPGRNASGKLPEASLPPAARESRQLSAVGTGYSGSTLDKVDVIAAAAEAETVRHGGRDVPVPEPVREVAREALAEVSRPGARVDRAYRQVQDALEEAAPPPDAEAPGPAPPARRRARRPLVETARDVAYHLDKMAGRVQRLADDDRLGRNREQVAASLRLTLPEMVRACADLEWGTNPALTATTAPAEAPDGEVATSPEAGTEAPAGTRPTISNFLFGLMTFDMATMLGRLSEADAGTLVEDEEWQRYVDLHAAIGRHIERCEALRPRLAAVTHLGAGGSGEPPAEDAG